MIKAIFTKAFLFIPVLCLVLFFFSSFELSRNEALNNKEEFKTILKDKTAGLIMLLKQMKDLSGVKFGGEEHEKLEKLFLESRNKYKELESFIIHFFPGDALALNPPDLPYPEEDDEVSIIYQPHGFQVLERLIFADSSNEGVAERKKELDLILKIVQWWPNSISNTEFPLREIFEAIQLGLNRTFLVGLTNIETPHCKNAIPEAIAYCNAVQEILSVLYMGNPLWVDKLQSELYPKFDVLKSFLAQQDSVTSPDYFTIYSKYFIPVSEILVKTRHFLVPDNFYNTTAVNLEVRSIFDPGAFNSYFFVPGKTQLNQKEIADLGRVLFFDPALSSNNERACASCHNPPKAFSDGLQVSRSFEKESMLERNAPGLLNSVLQKKLFHDGRAFTFENQASEVLNNPDEMHADFSKVALKLRKSAEYTSMFREAFRDTDDTLISSRTILVAIAEYERTLIALNSRFDKTMRGYEDLLTPEEKTGFNLFVGKANCASCHFIPLFNGTVPPEYVESEMEVLGVPGNADLNHPLKDLDPGRKAIIPMEMYRGAFKTPGLRNVELTAPYMHNGVFQTLDEVIEFYDRGGGVGIGLDIPNQTLMPDSLHLTQQEKLALKKFMLTLTDTVNTLNMPSGLPIFENDSMLNRRSVAGEY
ncbi:MAG TPA: cytochrome c peroxidase [Bacteroidia bacterium]|nr:cytochrome c peroxidase [Bacteroidia bacterium]